MSDSKSERPMSPQGGAVTLWHDGPNVNLGEFTDVQPYIGAPEFRAMPAADFDALLATLDAKRRECEVAKEALEACAAWHWAEDNRREGITHDECMELCRYSQFVTQNALRALNGEPPIDEKYAGVPHLIVWPSVYLAREEKDGAKALVDRILGMYRRTLLAKIGGGGE